MSASSVTGIGHGAAGKYYVPELANFANGPAIHLAGAVDVDDSVMSSPPSESVGVVRFPKSLPGSSDNYVVMLTALNGVGVYVAVLLEDADNNFSGFIASAVDGECIAMYMVVSKGMRPAQYSQI